MGYIKMSWLQSAVLALGSVSAMTATAANPTGYYQPDNTNYALPYDEPQPPNYATDAQYQQASYPPNYQTPTYQQPGYPSDVQLPPTLEPYQGQYAAQPWQATQPTQQYRPSASVPQWRYVPAKRVRPASYRPRIAAARPVRTGGSITEQRRALVESAYRSLGVNYVWGGNTPREGFDCSGLTKFTHKNARVSIPRTALEQSKASRTIQRQELRPGDMIFFRTSGKTVNHVGVYIGNGQMIHAASGSSHVRIDDLRKSYWQQRLVKYGTFLS